ncbi:triggering receptor expressed on myeloid cells 1 isoform X3 [Talpa occidentalis]|uniref:triggering receptor expressed on myeloid cells 1 isoform X3 n=1 Tax=Talpa occidentalis TaxID=50954 RepID=UPI00188E530F|nr:triggering receptor expressed on myeloid cells 1 isoform X3 [Talpa occidentalis]
MKKNRVRGLLWVFFLLISGLRVAAESEAVFTLAEGETFSVKCPTSTWKYSNSRKAWQRLDGAEPVNLVITERPAGKFTQARVGKYFLEDKPTEGLLEVQVTNLQEEDSGLYRCVIYHPPKDPEVLFQPIRLVVTKSIPGANGFSTLSPTIIETQSKPQTISTTNHLQSKTQTTSRTTTQISLMSTISAPVTNVTDVTRTSLISIVVLVACGILSKSLVFAVLLAVTQRISQLQSNNQSQLFV